jgi:DNA-directed RNA polymerase subunit RPC12/RpoP
MKLLTFGCPHCNSEALMHMQFRGWLARAFATAGAAAIIPDWIRCDWCRRKITVRRRG